MDSNETIDTVGAVNRVTRGEAVEESECFTGSTKQIFERTWPAQSLADGAATIDQMAEALEAEAAHLRELSAAGELAAAKYELEPLEEQLEEQDRMSPSYDTQLVKKAPYVTPEAPFDVLDIERLRVAVQRLRADGYAVLDGGCCPSCNWADIREQYPDAVDVVQFNDQSLDAAFGSMEATPEWRDYVDTPSDNEDESERRFEEWLAHWHDAAHPAAQRPGMLSDSLWIQHAGDTARAVNIMRGAGLDAVWDGDKGTAIEVRPRAGADGVINPGAVDLAGETADAVSHEAASFAS